MALVREALYEFIKKIAALFYRGEGFSSAMVGYATGELQLFAFFILLAALFRVFSLPLGVVVLFAVAGLTLYLAPLVGVFERENSSNVNMVLFWVVLYLAALMVIPMWGGG